MALSRIIRQANGSTDTFAVDFALDYLQESDVVAYVRGEVDGGGNQIYRAITFLDGGLMRVAGGNPPNLSWVVFDRTVEKDTLRVNFEDGDLLNEENLNAAFLQVWHAVHEALDARINVTDNLSMNGYRLTNVADPVNPGDAVNKAWVASTLEAAVEDAQMWAEAAAASAAQASASEAVANDAVAQITDWNEYNLGVRSSAPTETPLGNPLPNGATYYNNGPVEDERGAYIWVDTAWVPVTQAGALYNRQNFFPTNGQTSITASYDPNALAWISVNGVFYKIGAEIGDDVDASSGTALVFSEPFVGDEWVQLVTYTFHDVLVPAPASTVPVTPAGGITSSNVQAALQELQGKIDAANTLIAARALATVTVTGGGLATGGGDLSTNRIITVPKATSAEVIAGTDDTKATTPLGVAAAIAAGGGGGGGAVVGVVSDYAGITLPAKYLWCFGQTVSRTTYSLLLAALTATVTATASGTATLSGVSADLTGLGLEGAIVEVTGGTGGTATIVSLTSTTITLNGSVGTGAVTLKIYPFGNGNGTTTFGIPDYRGRVIAGRDNMGGTSAGRLLSTGTGGSVNGLILGASGGADRRVMSLLEMPQHNHGVTDPGHTHQYSGGSNAAGSGTIAPAGQSANAFYFGNMSASLTGISIQNAGSNNAQAHTQPTGVGNKIIYAGV